ncbi:hypothetical protein [Kutzneria albida]|nr:hypothetical protein [Kutzneria albida]
MRSAFRRFALFLAGLVVGALVIGLSGVLGSFDSGWWSSTLGNAGVTILLAVPVAIFLQRFSREIGETNAKVVELANSVDQTERRMRDIQEEVKAATFQEQERVGNLYSRPGRALDYTATDLVDLLREATESGLVSKRGIRVNFNDGPYVLVFQFDSEQVIISVAEAFGSAIFRHRCAKGANLVEILAKISTEISGRGGGRYDPLLPLEVLGSNLRILRLMRERSYPGEVDSVIQLLPDGWYVTDSALAHSDPVYSIGKEALLNEAENWERHLSKKAWINMKPMENALLNARFLLGNGK